MKQRVELHTHTNMSAMDGVDSAERLIRRATELGIKSMAITDRNGVQAFPEAAKAVARLAAQGYDVRVLYGMDVDCADGGHAFRMTILAQTKEGLKNLYRLVTLSHTKNTGEEEPQISKDELTAHRKGLLFGSGGREGELMQAVLSGQPWSRLLEIAGFYDYLEIQPFLDREANQTVVRLGEALNIPVCATGNVYFCSPEDEILRHILHDASAKADAEEPMPFYLRSTEEMLADFAYLGAETAEKLVVENPNRIADQIESLRPIPEGVYPPQIDHAEERLSTLVRQSAKARYGEPLPEIVRARMERELSQIEAHGYAGFYLTAQRIVEDSERHGYHAFSRGLVGSSLVAHLAGIADVNPLPPHYVCPHGHFTEFLSDGKVGSGFDLPEKACPKCGAALNRDGQDIPAEVFVGLNGEKAPDIDLNLAPAYLPAAYEFLQSQFGKERVLRGGTIDTVLGKRAVRYVLSYAEKHSLPLDEEEISRLAKRIEGVKRGTGCHLGGWMVIPAAFDAEDFTPVQIPETDPSSAALATHFDFYSLSGLFKQDLLGHDVLSVYRALEDATGVSVNDVPMCDPEVYSLFTSPEALGVTPEDIDCETGTLGLPELETEFVRQMLMGTRPKSFSDLMKISGLSHGTGVWKDNAQQLLAEGICSLSDVIALRDDVMLYLMRKGFPTEKAYEVMDDIRKGQSHRLLPEVRGELLAGGVPEWYLDSCAKIRYLFPKAHAASYMMAAVRLGWYKIHYPADFYAACLGARFDSVTEDEPVALSVLLGGAEAICRAYADCKKAQNDGFLSERGTAVYHLAYEAVQRGISFLPADSEKAPATGFYAENGVVLCHSSFGKRSRT